MEGMGEICGVKRAKEEVRSGSQEGGTPWHLCPPENHFGRAGVMMGKGEMPKRLGIKGLEMPYLWDAHTITHIYVLQKCKCYG